MAFSGKQAEAGALAFEQRVGRDGRAMHDPVGPGQQRGAVEAEAFGELLEPVEHADRRVSGGRGHFRQCRRA